MKRIYLTEDKINVIKERVISKLPSFLYKALSSHKTSLGNNVVFPSDDIYPFDYIITKKRFNEVSDTRPAFKKSTSYLSLTSLNV